MTPRLLISAIAFVAFVALLSGAYAKGRADGRALEAGAYAAQLAEAQARTMRAAEQASRAEADRLEMEAQRDALARDLEDQAYADKDETGGLPRNRVGRLRQK